MGNQSGQDPTRRLSFRLLFSRNTPGRFWRRFLRSIMHIMAEFTALRRSTNGAGVWKASVEKRPGRRRSAALPLWWHRWNRLAGTSR
jgi:hypothetical protein